MASLERKILSNGRIKNPGILQLNERQREFASGPKKHGNTIDGGIRPGKEPKSQFLRRNTAEIDNSVEGSGLVGLLTTSNARLYNKGDKSQEESQKSMAKPLIVAKKVRRVEPKEIPKMTSLVKVTERLCNLNYLDELAYREKLEEDARKQLLLTSPTDLYKIDTGSTGLPRILTKSKSQKRSIQDRKTNLNTLSSKDFIGAEQSTHNRLSTNGTHKLKPTPLKQNPTSADLHPSAPVDNVSAFNSPKSIRRSQLSTSQVAGRGGGQHRNNGSSGNLNKVSTLNAQVKAVENILEPEHQKYLPLKSLSDGTYFKYMNKVEERHMKNMIQIRLNAHTLLLKSLYSECKSDADRKAQDSRDRELRREAERFKEVKRIAGQGKLKLASKEFGKRVYQQNNIADGMIDEIQRKFDIPEVVPSKKKVRIKTDAVNHSSISSSSSEKSHEMFIGFPAPDAFEVTYTDTLNAAKLANKIKEVEPSSNDD
jgi:hypothetical protein